MNKVLIFAGTTEGREIACCLAKSGIECVACVATEYGEQVIPAQDGLHVHTGRMDAAEMLQFMKESLFAAVVDATHPFAVQVSENIKACTAQLQIPYLRLSRQISGSLNTNICYVKNSGECAKVLQKTEGNILLTTGSKELSVYCHEKSLRSRLYARVLPAQESIQICKENGLSGKQILCMQGPFSEELNLALIHQYQISCMVTKESGKAGGFPEKLAAAEHAGILTVVIGNPEKEEGMTFQEVLAKLEKITGTGLCRGKTLDIVLAGIGMGNQGTITEEAAQAIAEADIIFGAKRLLSSVPVQNRICFAEKEVYPFYLAKDIIPCLEQKLSLSDKENNTAAVLFSGDSGFYSGCQSVHQALINWKNSEFVRKNGVDVTVKIYPGISSVSYLAAKAGVSWQDAEIISLHGRKEAGWKSEVISSSSCHKKTFLILSGIEQLHQLGKLLTERGLTHCRMTVGYQLSYEEEIIKTVRPSECVKFQQEGLYTCLIQNLNPQKKYLTHGLADDQFIRGKVPMTKEEVRTVSISKLHLYEGAVVYDIGSGTGSVAVETGRLSSSLQVYAIERKEEACTLIQENCQRFGLDNVTIVKAEAPEGFTSLPAPTHAFIGGSGNRLQEILKALYEKNPEIRIVMNAVSLETLAEIKTVLDHFSVTDEEIVQLHVSRSRQAGSYHLMQAENPVTVFAFCMK